MCLSIYELAFVDFFTRIDFHFHILSCMLDVPLVSYLLLVSFPLNLHRFSGLKNEIMTCFMSCWPQLEDVMFRSKRFKTCSCMKSYSRNFLLDILIKSFDKCHVSSSKDENISEIFSTVFFAMLKRKQHKKSQKCFSSRCRKVGKKKTRKYVNTATSWPPLSSPHRGTCKWH